jgi:hypothetical protein
MTRRHVSYGIGITLVENESLDSQTNNLTISCALHLYLDTFVTKATDATTAFYNGQIHTTVRAHQWGRKTLPQTPGHIDHTDVITRVSGSSRLRSPRSSREEFQVASTNRKWKWEYRRWESNIAYQPTLPISRPRITQTDTLDAFQR